jgi:hypothetical protein
MAMLLGMYSMCAAQSTKPAISITINSSPTVVKTGTEVKVEITLTNVSNHQITLAKDNAQNHGESFNRIEVRDQKGNLAPDTRYARFLKGKVSDDDKRQDKNKAVGDHGVELVNDLPLDSAAPHVLKPGETLKDEIVVTKLFDLSTPGKYTIQVDRHDDEGKTTVKANAITVTVTP